MSQVSRRALTPRLGLAALVLCLAGTASAGSGPARGERVAQVGAARATGERSGTAPQPTGEHLSEAQKANLETLAKDLNAIKADSAVTEEQKQALATSMKAISDGATRPSDESIATLTNSLATAKKDGQLDPTEAKQLATDVAVVLASANVPPDEVEAAIKSAQSLLEASGLSKDDAAKLAADLKLVAAEIQKNVEAGKATVQESGETRQRRRR